MLSSFGLSLLTSVLLFLCTQKQNVLIKINWSGHDAELSEKSNLLYKVFHETKWSVTKFRTSSMTDFQTMKSSASRNEIDDLFGKKDYIIAIDKIGNKDCYNVKFKSNHPLYSHKILTVSVDMGGDYPFRPPSVRFAHPLYHPNIDGMGDICIPILCFDNWKPATTLEDIMTSLIQILGEPDLSRPICQDIMEEYVKDPSLYKKNLAECLKRLPSNRD